MEPNLNVLVVDDDPSIVEMIRLGLETDGMHVLSAGDGAEALDVAIYIIGQQADVRVADHLRLRDMRRILVRPIHMPGKW